MEFDTQRPTELSEGEVRLSQFCCETVPQSLSCSSKTQNCQTCGDTLVAAYTLEDVNGCGGWRRLTDTAAQSLNIHMNTKKRSKIMFKCTPTYT